METEGLDFAGALESLADRYGVRSSWNGHSPESRRAPDRRSSVRAPTSSSKSTASRTRSRESCV